MSMQSFSARGSGVISMVRTVACNELSDGEIISLAQASGITGELIDNVRRLFHQYADETSFGLDGRCFLSEDAGMRLFREVIQIQKEKYAKQCFYAFRAAGLASPGENAVGYPNSLSLRGLLLGLVVMDPNNSSKPLGDQFLRCRLEMLFRFYDLDQDETWDYSEFAHFIRHLYAANNKPTAENDTETIWGRNKDDKLTLAKVVNHISKGRLHQYGYEQLLCFDCPLSTNGWWKMHL
uniref:Uncharacterized protein n=1 Tax=Aplanochytrium stocchinoi TaxID=215587 RepID=A0A7S3LRR4_9STRA|mmetsp:Transcript_6879/g.8982  ORF Transcript_6879/g.8982 Transcript_6879/m.8982 type:complete len:237 (-) Transcript_6879:1094-1804(-)